MLGFLGLHVIFSGVLTFASASKTEAAKSDAPAAKEAATQAASAAQPSKEDLKRITEVDQKYVKAGSIKMDLEKTLKLSLLGQERKAKGRLVISKGRLRMEIDEPDKSLVVVNKKNLWVANYPPKEFKNAAPQVIRGDVNSKKGRSQSFVGLLAQGGLLKYFKVTGVQAPKDGNEAVYFLQPESASVEFKRAQVTLGKDGKSIRELRYWDEMDNETRFEFSNVVWNDKVPEKSFEFSPPAGAEVTSL